MVDRIIKFLRLPKRKKIDTGLRGTYRGDLYVDKEVFYKRPEVQKVILDIQNNKAIQEQLRKNS